MQPVRCRGRNSLLVWSSFEKHFFRPNGQDPASPEELGGLNVHATSGLVGPGYFVARRDRARGEATIDYRQVPATVPERWPSARDNDHGVARLVFGGMFDTLRAVSAVVMVGRASRRGREMDAYFILCRSGDA
jgi:hypothetical protein